MQESWASRILRDDELRKAQPPYALAIAAGVMDVSYPTVRYGTVAAYRGHGDVTMPDGSRWHAVGHMPDGDAGNIWRRGWIEFTRL